MTIKFAIITCSDTRTLETDEAGQKLEQLIAEQGWECVRRVVEMDERPFIAGALIDACDNTDADIVLTCGGSGLSLRDVTPEATRDVADREVPGIAEAMRAHSVINFKFFFQLSFSSKCFFNLSKARINSYIPYLLSNALTVPTTKSSLSSFGYLLGSNKFKSTPNGVIAISSFSFPITFRS